MFGPLDPNFQMQIIMIFFFLHLKISKLLKYTRNRLISRTEFLVHLLLLILFFYNTVGSDIFYYRAQKSPMPIYYMQWFQSKLNRVAPDIRPAGYPAFLISGIRPDIRFRLPDIRLEKQF